MAISSYPYVDQPTSDVEYSRLFRELQDNGAAGSYGDTTVQVYANSTGLNTFVRAGSAIVRGYYFYNTADIPLVHAAASANPRIDRVVLRLDLTQPIGSRIVAAIKQGTPAVSPTVPALTQTDTGIYEISLAQVLVMGSTVTIAPGDVSDERSFIGANTGVWSTFTRPATARRGKLGLNVTTGKWEQYGTSGWTDMAIDGTQLTSGLIPVARIPAHSAALLTSGTLDNNRLSGIPYTKIASVDASSVVAAVGQFTDPFLFQDNVIRGRMINPLSVFTVTLAPQGLVKSGSNVNGTYQVLAQLTVYTYVLGPVVYMAGLIEFQAIGAGAGYWVANDGLIVAVGGTGNITNLTLNTGQAVNPLYTPIREAAFSPGSIGGALGLALTPAGLFVIGSVAPNTDITINTSWNFTGTYFRSSGSPLGS